MQKCNISWFHTFVHLCIIYTRLCILCIICTYLCITHTQICFVCTQMCILYTHSSIFSTDMHHMHTFVHHMFTNMHHMHRDVHHMHTLVRHMHTDVHHVHTEARVSERQAFSAPGSCWEVTVERACWFFVCRLMLNYKLPLCWYWPHFFLFFSRPNTSLPTSCSKAFFFRDIIIGSTPVWTTP